MAYVHPAVQENSVYRLLRVAGKMGIHLQVRKPKMLLLLSLFTSC